MALQQADDAAGAAVSERDASPGPQNGEGTAPPSTTSDVDAESRPASSISPSGSSPYTPPQSPPAIAPLDSVNAEPGAETEPTSAISSVSSPDPRGTHPRPFGDKPLAQTAPPRNPISTPPLVTPPAFAARRGRPREREAVARAPHRRECPRHIPAPPVPLHQHGFQGGLTRRQPPAPSHRNRKRVSHPSRTPLPARGPARFITARASSRGLSPRAMRPRRRPLAVKFECPALP